MVLPFIKLSYVTQTKSFWNKCYNMLLEELIHLNYLLIKCTHVKGEFRFIYHLNKI